MAEHRPQEENLSLQFESPRDCVAETQRELWSRPYGSTERKGEQQHHCIRCRLWKYEDERCNLFIRGSQRPQP